MSHSNDVNRADSPTTTIGRSGDAPKGGRAPEFTPGPWFASISALPIGGTAFVGTAEQIADDRAQPVASNIDSAADALLICAAPDLYAALERALPYLEACAEEQGGYGFFCGGDPRKFHPDEESSTPEEIAAHKAACARMDAGESKGESPACQHAVVEGHAVRINTGKFGLGSYTYADEQAVAALAAARAALAKARGQ